MKLPIYLDANASVPPIKEAKEALIAALDAANPSSPHVLGRQARILLDDARAEVAKALGGQEKEIFFTSGATEGNRWLVDAVVKAGKNFGKPLRVLTTPLEHPSVAKPLDEAHAQGEIVLERVKVKQSGELEWPKVIEAEVVFTTAVHNETGCVTSMQPILDAIGEKTIWIVDAAQAVARLGGVLSARVDAVVCSAHKMGGYPGVGAVLLRGNARNLPAPWKGGGQEGNLRPGTEAVQLIAAFGAAARHINSTRDAHVKLARLRDEMEMQIVNSISGAHVLGGKVQRISNTSAIMFDGIDGEALRIALDVAGLCVGFGSACSALAPEPSPALLAMGLTPTQARSTVRISLPPNIGEEAVKQVTKQLIDVISYLKQN